MLIKGKKFGKKFMFYIKDKNGNRKVAFGNIEHSHGNERCWVCVGKDYPWVFLGIKVSKMCCK